MSKGDVIQKFAQILTGLQVPASMNKLALGTAYEPWVQLRDLLSLPGWHNEEDVVKKLTEIFIEKDVKASVTG